MAIAPQEIPMPIRKLTVDDVIEMGRAGIIAETERVELVDGVLVEMSWEGTDHPALIAALNMRLARAYPLGSGIRVQSALPTSRFTSLVPDLAVSSVNPRDRYLDPADMLLVVEVAVSSRRWDLGRKLRLYAGWGVPEYWVVDVQRDRVVVHRDPNAGGYRSVQVATGDDLLPLPGIDEGVTATEVLRG